MKCAELELFLTDYLEGELDKARTDELLDHVESCAACRAEFQAYQEQDKHLRTYYKRELDRTREMENPVPAAPVVDMAALRRRRSSQWLMRAVAAVLFVALGVGGWSVYRRAVPTGHAVLAHAREVNGYVLALDASTALAPDAAIRQKERIRVPRDGYLSLTLTDGNVVEARGGTQLALLDFPDRLEIAMDRGQVWAHLKNRPAKSFVVRTAHLSAMAHGTVYSVEEGLDRSVVTVAEGEVIVEADAFGKAGGAQTTVGPAQAYSSRTGLVESAADSAAVAWSRFRENLSSLAALFGTGAGPATPQLVVRTASASSAPASSASASSAPASAAATETVSYAPTDLIAYLPENTLYVLDLRDLQGLMKEFHASDYAALRNNPAIRQWWEAAGGRKIFDELVNETRIDKVMRMAAMLDGQLTMGVTAKGDFVFVAECGDNEENIRLELEAQLGISVTPDAGEGLMNEVAREAEAVDRYPQGAPGKDLKDRLYVAARCVVFSNDDKLARDTIERLAQGRPTGFDQGGFWTKIRRDADNPRFAMAANLGGQVAKLMSELADERHAKEVQAMSEFLGTPSLDYLLISPSFEGRGTNQAARLAFVDSGRYGVMNWIAEPAPMRALEFFSPTIPLFASAVVRNPNRMCLDYLAYLEETAPKAKFTEALSVVAEMKDFFESFGGEIAVGLDKPVLPVPNVKVAIEMGNPAAFQAGIERIVVWIQDEMEGQGKLSVVEEVEHQGYTIRTLVIDGVPLFQPSWTYINGFFVAGPGPQFVRNSIEVFKSGHTIAQSSRFLNLVPGGAEMNFSLLVYQDVAQSVPSFIKEKVLPNMNDETKGLLPDLSFLEAYSAPGIAYAYARSTCVDVYLNAPTGIDLNLGMSVPMVANWLIPRTGIGQAVSGVARAQVALDEMKTAALAYEAENGRLPQNLSELAQPAGQYIERIPLDPFAPGLDETVRLIVGPGEGEITIYSVGPDGVDDRGAVEYDMAKEFDGPGDVVVRLPEPQPAAKPE